MNDKQSFAFGLNGIKAIGISKWSKDFFWPVSYEQFRELYETIWDGFQYIIDTEDEEFAEIVESRCKLANYWAQLIHLEIVSDQIKSRRIKYDRNEYHPFLRFEGIGFGFNDMLNKHKLRKFLSSVKISVKTSLKRRIHFPIKGFVTNIGDLCPLKYAYLQQNHKLIIPRSLPNIVGRFSKINYESNNRTQIDMLVSRLISQVRERIEKLDIYLPESLLKHFHAISLSEYLLFGALQEQIKKNIAKWTWGDILAGGIGNPLYRCILIANSRIGGHSIGVSHGNNVGLYQHPLYFRQELSAVDEFLVPTKEARNSLRKIINKSEHLKKINTRITSVDLPIYKRQWVSEKIKPISKRIRQVMYMGFPFVYYRDFEYPETFTPIQVDFEYRILSLLKSRYFVIYKAHPDRLLESEEGKIWADIVDKIETRPFETVYDDADAYIFGSTGSTTFCFSLLTKKRVIFFDTGHPIHAEEPKRLLLKRAIAIKAWFDDRNRLMFDEEELKSALAKPIEEPDTEFIQKYMLP